MLLARRIVSGVNKLNGCRYISNQTYRREIPRPESATITTKPFDKPPESVLQHFDKKKEANFLICGDWMKPDDALCCAQVCPHEYSDTNKMNEYDNHYRSVCSYPLLDNGDEVEALSLATKYAEVVSMSNRAEWASIYQGDRNRIMLKAVKIIEEKYKNKILAATMIGQSKTYHEAMVDYCELIDFFNFSVHYMKNILTTQPFRADREYNFAKYAQLPGFVASITPFNFTAIGGHLALAPLLVGNNVIWKPSPNAVLSNYYILEAMIEAGVPKETIQFIACDPQLFVDNVLTHKHLSAVAFTGSTQVLDSIFEKVYSNMGSREYYPRVIGESGGKNFHLALTDTDPEYFAEQTVQSAYGYGGQKCSAASRVLIPKSREEEFKKALIEKTKEVTVGPVESGAFMGPLVGKEGYQWAGSVIHNITSPDTLLYDGGTEFPYVHPKIVEVPMDNNNSPFITTEFFAPIIGLQVYDDGNGIDIYDDRVDELIKHIGEQTKYGLTGSIFYDDKNIIEDELYYDRINRLLNGLSGYVGNLYFNTKSTGSVVGHQWFGGGRKSGTNDKAGGPFFLLRFINQMVTKKILGS
jgi:1-pyrroline-5-carboxylate dehydrogenase